jgi:hypothetical protein
LGKVECLDAVENMFLRSRHHKNLLPLDRSRMRPGSVTAVEVPRVTHEPITFVL